MVLAQELLGVRSNMEDLMRIGVFFLLVAVTVLTTGCPDKHPYATPHIEPFDPAKESEFHTTDTYTLAPKSADGVSKNDTSYSLETNPGRKRLFLPFNFTAEGYQHLLVKTPIVTAESCSEKPEFGVWSKEDSAGKTVGTESASQLQKGFEPNRPGNVDDQALEYETKMGVEPNTDYSIVLVFNVAGSCTKLNVQFDVQFSK